MTMNDIIVYILTMLVDDLGNVDNNHVDIDN